MLAHHAGAAGQVQQHEHADRQEHAVDRLGRHDDGEGVEAGGRAHNAAQHNGDVGEEVALVAAVQLPAEQTGQHIGNAQRGDDGAGDAGADQADGQEGNGQVAQQRLQLCGHVDGGVDFHAAHHGAGGDHDRAGDEAADDHGAAHVKLGQGDLLGVLPGLAGAGGMDEQVVGNHGGADEGHAGHDGAAGNGGDHALKHFAPIGLYHKHGHAEHHGHHADADGQQLFQPLNGVLMGVQEQDAHAPDGCDDTGRHAGEGRNADGRTGQVAAHVGHAAQNDGGGHQRHHKGAQGRAVFEFGHQVFGQAVLGNNAQAGRHALHDDHGDHREYHAPQQLVAVSRTGAGGAGHSARADERANHQQARAHRFDFIL